MNVLVSSLLFVTILHFSNCGPLRIQKRAAFYIANETACVVDNTVYSNGDPIPTDDPCEACKCRPPGFACVLKECEVKPGCRAVRRAGHCCPDYICGCEHNGRMYRDGDEIRDSQNPCYTCHCQGSSIACAFEDCFFRVDCAPEYVPGECCPHYTNCTAPKNPFDGSNPYLKDKEPSVDTTIVPSSVIVPGVSYVEVTTEPQNVDTTVIEIFELETKQPEILQFNPEAVSVIDRIVSEEYSKESSLKDEVTPIYSETPDTETLSTETDKDVELKGDEETTETHYGTDKVIMHHEIFTPKTDSDETESETSEHSTEISLQPEAPLITDNVNVEPEEPSNNLESESLSSDYGKSLKFDDAKVPINETMPEEQRGENQSEELKSGTEIKEQESETEIKEQNKTEPKDDKSQTEQENETKIKEHESSTQQTQKLLYIKDSVGETFTTKLQEETSSISSTVEVVTDEEIKNLNLSSNSGSTEKVPLYRSEDSAQTESVETVTIEVEIKEHTTDPTANKSDLSITPTIADSLFNFNSDKLDQKSTQQPEVTSVKIDETVKSDVESELPPKSKDKSSSTETVLPTTFPEIDDATITTKFD